jgi:hypothetical protein
MAHLEQSTQICKELCSMLLNGLTEDVLINHIQLLLGFTQEFLIFFNSQKLCKKLVD